MRITIIGWYGTETIGDRAILAGLFDIWAKSIVQFEIKLGCLDTVLSERTIDDDYAFMQECSLNTKLQISLFDSRRKKDLDDAIRWADIIVIGGGPLMEIDAMYMLLYAFKKAKKLHKRSFVAGCGLGPFRTEKLLKTAIEIIDTADVVIFRDSKSQSIYSANTLHDKKTYASIDPAVFAAQHYSSIGSTTTEESFAAVNFREPTAEYTGIQNNSDTLFTQIVKDVASINGIDVRLIPMHTFNIGGDDRYILSRIKRKTGMKNVYVYNRPTSLEQTLNIYKNAQLCIGMRFHSVLLQTILSGKNFIIDYTDPEKGKTINLLNQLQLKEKYENRYFSLVQDGSVPVFNYSDIKQITVARQLLDSFYAVYIDAFKCL